MHPVYKNMHVIGQGNGSSLFLSGHGQFLAQGVPFGLLLGTPHLGLEVLAGVDAFVGTPLQEHCQLRQFHLSVEHIPVTGHSIAPSGPLSGTQGCAAVSDGSLKVETPLAQIQQMMGQPMDTVVSPSPDIFIGEYEVDVESHSTELRNPVLKEQKAREMAMAIIQMAPLLMQLGVNVNYKRLLEDWFEKAGVQDIEGFLEIAPDQGMGVAPAPAEASQPEPGPGEPPTDLQDPSMMGALTSENTGQFPIA